MKTMKTNSDWQRSETEIFWGEIALCEHLVQIYEDDGAFLDALDGFVAGGFRVGDGIIAIATPAHLKALDDRLRAHGVNIDAAQSRDQYTELKFYGY
ncbi:MAG: MEDS domain-containing protein [bacterium]